ncbi:hypothetical protein BHE74_00050878, partial [Ensete ventricosum]
KTNLNEPDCIYPLKSNPCRFEPNSFQISRFGKSCPLTNHRTRFEGSGTTNLEILSPDETLGGFVRRHRRLFPSLVEVGRRRAADVSERSPPSCKTKGTRFDLLHELSYLFAFLIEVWLEFLFYLCVSVVPRYKPGPDFEEDSRTPLVDISLTDSTELWLIQWPINQASAFDLILQPADFNGKELTLKLNRDGKLGGFESASGKMYSFVMELSRLTSKSYDFVSFAAHEPDATVFLPSVSETKVGKLKNHLLTQTCLSSVGKISRRVCLVHYPEPGELEKPRFSLSSQRTEGLSSQRTEGASTAPSEISARSADRSSHASGLESEITNNSLISDRSHREKSKKKKMVKLEE